MRITLIVLTIEFALLFLCFGGLLGVRLTRNWQARQTARRRKALQQLFADAMQKQEILRIDQIAPSLLNYQDLLTTVETFDRFFLDSIWQETKQRLIDAYLAKKARLLVQSARWRDRLLGLRCIALNPKQLLDERTVAPLLNDKKFIVRILAASSMVRTEQKELLLPVLKRMVQEPPIGRYAYRDLLINGGEHIFQWIEEIADQETDPPLVAASLDVLAARISHNLLPLAIKHIYSPDLACRLAAIKIFASIPSHESTRHLTQLLLDENWQIRAAAAQGLGKILALSSIPELSRALQDSEWSVRLQAASALKAMGKEGIAALYRQDAQQHPAAYEIAKYILAIP